MPERKRPAAEQPAPPIPDGGLGEAMPEWLRRPPAWHTEQAAVPPRRALPPPDESEIDPVSLLTVEDLPDWLQSLANPRRIPTLVAARPPATPERRVIPRVIEATDRTPPSAPLMSAQPERAASDVSGAPIEEVPASSFRDEPVPLDLRMRGQSNAAIVLGTLLGVAVVAIVVLLVLLLT